MFAKLLSKIDRVKKTSPIASAYSFDWILFCAALLISLAGLVTMNSFLPALPAQAGQAGVGENYFFSRQILWLSISVLVFFILSVIDWRFLRRTTVVAALFILSSLFLLGLFIAGKTVHGAQSWFYLGGFSFQPSDPIKLVVILLLSKYFARRHIEIANIRHILVSGFYAFIIFLLVLLQPDFGSAIIIFLIWLGMVLVSGISKKHLLAVFLISVVSFAGLWIYGFKDYQKQRIKTFLHPLTDVRGAGYNAYQSTIAVGSGKVFGKGIGYGTQSKLQFLPAYQTDFIFAAFAEEWGFLGVLILLTLFGIVIWKIIVSALHGASNFETLFCAGLALFFMAQVVIHLGMNIGLLPVTGVTLPFMSYGGSHLLTEFAGLGILSGMQRYRRAAPKDAVKAEVLEA